MLVRNTIDKINSKFKNSIVSIGNFDGFHVGHKKIIKELVLRAKKNKKKSIVVTFYPHPKEILHPESKHLYLTSKEQKLEYLKKMGVDVTIVIRFNRAFSKIEPIDFFKKILFKKLHFSELIVGENHGFGREKKGGIDLITRLSLELGFRTHFIKPVKVGHEVVSSSLIRRKISEGKLKEAEIMLGRKHDLFGKVVHGLGVGCEIGIPTANLDYGSIVLPPKGVYVVKVKVKSGKYLGVANIGLKPTVKRSKKYLELEVHIIKFKKKIYGEIIKIEFLKKIRREIKFKNLKDLVQQIRKDIKKAEINYLRYLKEMC